LGHIVCVDWADVAAVLDTEGDRQALKPEQQDGGPFTIEDIEARWSNVPTWHDGPAASKDIRWLIEQLRQAQLPGPTPLCVVCGKVA
jgi:hypothetical protein